MEVSITDLQTRCMILALINFIEFCLCVKDWWHDPSAKSWWGAIAWLGSTLFWLARPEVVPI